MLFGIVLWLLRIVLRFCSCLRFVCVVLKDRCIDFRFVVQLLVLFFSCLVRRLVVLFFVAFRLGLLKKLMLWLLFFLGC